MALRKAKSAKMKFTALHEDFGRHAIFAHLGKATTHECMLSETGKHVALHKLDVYVLTPDQLERRVQQLSRRLHPSMPSVHLISA